MLHKYLFLVVVYFEIMMIMKIHRDFIAPFLVFLTFVALCAKKNRYARTRGKIIIVIIFLISFYFSGGCKIL